MNRNYRCALSLIMLLLMWVSTLSAQIVIREIHVPNFKDSLLASKLPGCVISDSGCNCLWDFSSLPMDRAEIVPVDYYALSKNDTTRIGIHRERTHYFVVDASDTLWLTGYETSNKFIQYSSFIPLIRYPFSYGDSIVSKIEGKGQYCHRTPITIEGYAETRADANGRLLLPDLMVDSVLRVHSVQRYTEIMNKETIITEERYQWYSAYCRYPLLEIIGIQTVFGNDTTYVCSTYYYPEELVKLPRHITEIQNTATIIDGDNLITGATYVPNPVQSDLIVSFSLVRAASVYISLHYNGGVSVFQTPRHKETEGAHSISINTSGLPLGNYVVYIHADDIVASGNVIKY